MLGSLENIEYVKRLNGKLHIIRGNHDTNVRWKEYAELPNVVEMAAAIYLDYKKYHFYLSHYPTLTGNIEKESIKQMTLNIFGHTHQTQPYFEDNFFMYNCGVDANGCHPISIDDIIDAMKFKFNEVNKQYQEIKQLYGNTDQIRYDWIIYHSHICNYCSNYKCNCGGPSFIDNLFKCPGNGLMYKK